MKSPLRSSAGPYVEKVVSQVPLSKVRIFTRESVRSGGLEDLLFLSFPDLEKRGIL